MEGYQQISGEEFNDIMEGIEREIQRLRAENEALKKELYILLTDILWNHTKTAFIPLSLAEKAKEIKERFFEAAKE